MAKRKPISEVLRAEIKASGLTCYMIAKRAGCKPDQVGRFIKRERDVTLGTAERIAEVLGLELSKRK